MDSFKELGKSLYRISNKIIENEELCKLLYYTDKNPLAQPALTDSTVLLNENVIIAPEMPETINDRGATISIIFEDIELDEENNEFLFIRVNFLVLLHPKYWLINDIAPRPFLIMNHLKEMFHKKKIKGIGNFKMKGASFTIPSKEFAGYGMTYVYSDFD